MPGIDWFLTLVIVLVVVGGIVYLVDRLPIDATFKMVAKVVAIVGFVIWLIMAVRQFIG
jgi:amino acid permease